MVEDIDIWRTANVLIKQHGDRAAADVARRMVQMLDRDDIEGYRVWLRVLGAVRELQNTSPPSEAMLN